MMIDFLKWTQISSVISLVQCSFFILSILEGGAVVVVYAQVL